MLSINTNLSSLIAQGSMKSSTSKLNQAIERMTTGFKINHAKDNAANYSISTNMTTKIGSYNVAEDNVAQGLDLLTTAEENLDLIYNHVQRLRDLAEQASNGTYGEQSLNAINAEANALVDEINRIYENAEYNGLKLFKTAPTDMVNPIAAFSLERSSSSAFINAIARRNTTSMTTLASVDGAADLVDGTYSISTAEELEKLATMTNNGLISAGDEFVLADNIDLSAYSNWTPIGNSSEGFAGVFDGNGYTISNLTTSGYDYAGLFGSISSESGTNAKIKNLAITQANVQATDYAGILAGFVRTEDSEVIDSPIIDNCSVDGRVQSDCNAGGLIGMAGVCVVEIKNCYVNADVTGDNDAAGLVNTGFYSCFKVDNCVVDGTVTGKYAGGIVNHDIVTNFSGYDVGLSNSIFLGTVSGTNGAGGVAVELDDSLSGTITNSYYDAEKNPGIEGVGASEFTVANLGKTTSQLAALTPTLKTPTGTSGMENSGAGSGGAGNPGTTPSSPSGNGSCAPEIVYLQIGIGSGEHSQISFNIKFSIDGLEELRNIGLSISPAAYGLRSGASPIGDLTRCDEILNALQEKAVEFGAVQNRLESVLEEITIQRDNLVSSRSTIRDADIAEVSSHYIQQQILQQASATLLATANQSPAIALQLI